MKLVDRIGAALVSPRRAFEAVEAGEGGMPDAMWLVLLKVVCTETTILYTALLSLVTRGPRAVLAILAARLGAVVGADLILLALAGLVITAAVGARRDMTRDFDLAAVTWVPVLAVDALAMLILRLTGSELTAAGQTLLRIVAFSWMATLCVLAVRHARRRPEVKP